MPGLPLSSLIVDHAALAFGFLKHAFNPIPLALHPRQDFNTGCLQKIGQRYLRVRFSSSRLAWHQKPFIASIRYAVPHINRFTKDPHFQQPSTGLTQFQKWQIGKAIIAHNFAEFKTFGIGSVASEFATTLGFVLRNIGRRVFQLHVKIRVDIHNESLIHLGKCPAKSRTLAITGVGTDPSKPKPVFASVLHDFNSKLIFGFKAVMSFRNAGFGTALGILGPRFGQIQAHINRNSALVIRQRAEHRHLPAVNFSQSAQPLARRTYRHPPYLVSGTTSDMRSMLLREPARIRPHAYCRAFSVTSWQYDWKWWLKLFTKDTNVPYVRERRLWGCIRFPLGFRTLSPGLVSFSFL